MKTSFDAYYTPLILQIEFVRMYNEDDIKVTLGKDNTLLVTSQKILTMSVWGIQHLCKLYNLKLLTCMITYQGQGTQAAFTIEGL